MQMNYFTDSFIDDSFLSFFFRVTFVATLRWFRWDVARYLGGFLKSQMETFSNEPQIKYLIVLIIYTSEKYRPQVF